MPTPSPDVAVAPVEQDVLAGRSICPPEESRIVTAASLTANNNVDSVPNAPMQQPTSPPLHFLPDTLSKVASTDRDSPSRDIPTPMTATDDGAEEQRTSQPSPISISPSAIQLYPAFPAHRFLPNSSSTLLRPGSRFRGSQTSDSKQYEVEVEVKHVDMRESFMCGYLRIKGLTKEHPSLTTYFEGEIIGSKHTFITQHPEWGSNEKVDRQHWARFPAYKPLSKYSSRPSLTSKDWAHKEHLFMRWKEYFLIPDHRVQTINGASFEGFYYICFNQVYGGIEGIYFHAKSEKFQKLQLEHVQDHGCHGAIEFR